MSLTDELSTFIRSSLMHDTGPAPAPDESLIDRGLVDSIGLIQLVSFIEAHTGLRVPDEYLTPDHFETIETIEAMIRELRATQRPG